MKPKASPVSTPSLDDYVAAFCSAPLTRKAVMDLSSMLGQVVGTDLRALLPDVTVEVGERTFGGSIRRHHLDCFVANAQLGLQLGIDVKGLNSPTSVGKNWNNRVGDLHELATNHHHQFPKAVIGGVLAIPYEGITAATLKNIERALTRLNGRRAISNAHNLLESTALLVISKKEGVLRQDLPEPPIRFETFATRLATTFQERWE